jgi:hypothetical protein
MDKQVLPKGHTSILSPGFKYVPAAGTDIAKTFARVRQQLKQEERPAGNVAVLKPRRPS